AVLCNLDLLVKIPGNGITSRLDTGVQYFHEEKKQDRADHEEESEPGRRKKVRHRQRQKKQHQFLLDGLFMSREIFQCPHGVEKSQKNALHEYPQYDRSRQSIGEFS